MPTVDELGAAGLIDSSSVDNAIFGTGKFFKEQSMDQKQNDIYEDIDEAIKKALKQKRKALLLLVKIENGSRFVALELK